MFQDLPSGYTRSMVLELLESINLKNRYDFMYFPYDFNNKSNFGWAQVNMLTHQDATIAFQKLNGFAAWKLPSQKILSVPWSKPLQDLLETWVHPGLPKQLKPLRLEKSDLVSFSSSTEIKPWRLETSDLASFSSSIGQIQSAEEQCILLD